MFIYLWSPFSTLSEIVYTILILQKILLSLVKWIKQLALHYNQYPVRNSLITRTIKRNTACTNSGKKTLALFTFHREINSYTSLLDFVYKWYSATPNCYKTINLNVPIKFNWRCLCNMIFWLILCNVAAVFDSKKNLMNQVVSNVTILPHSHGEQVCFLKNLMSLGDANSFNCYTAKC